jgi:hypothetical protein
VSTPQPSRRGVLASVAAVLPLALVGCSPDEAPDQPGGSRTVIGAAPDDPDVVVVVDAIADEAALLTLCSRTEQVHPELRDVVRPVAARQRAHVRRLRSSLSVGPEEPVPTRPGVPRSRKAAVAKVRDHVSAAEQSRLDECLGATSGLLARLLASISASHAVTVDLLRETT